MESRMKFTTTQPDPVIRAFYASLSFKTGEAPDLAGLKALFHSSGRLTRCTPRGWDTFSVDEFIVTYERVLRMGFLSAFVEKEVWRETHVFGSVGQVFSAYEARRSPEDSAPYACGINSMQLVFEEGKWFLLSVVWDEKNPGHPAIYERVPPK